MNSGVCVGVGVGVYVGVGACCVGTGSSFGSGVSWSTGYVKLAVPEVEKEEAALELGVSPLMSLGLIAKPKNADILVLLRSSCFQTEETCPAGTRALAGFILLRCFSRFLMMKRRKPIASVCACMCERASNERVVRGDSLVG